jgi:hypothetical protein
MLANEQMTLREVPSALFATDSVPVRAIVPGAGTEYSSADATMRIESPTAGDIEKKDRASP